MIQLKFFKDHAEASIPKLATEGSACFDVQACIPTGTKIKYFSYGATAAAYREVADDSFSLAPFYRALVPTGLILDIPKGHSVRAHPRSGLSFKNGLTLANSEAILKVEDDQFLDSLSGIAAAGFTGIGASPTQHVQGTGNTFAALAYADILTMIGSATSGQANGARIYMNRAVWFNYVRGLLAAQNYLVNPQDYVLEGYNVTLTDSVTGSTAVDTDYIYFANPKNTIFVDRSMFTIKTLTEANVDGVSLGETDQIGFALRERFSIQNLQQAATHTVTTGS